MNLHDSTQSTKITCKIKEEYEKREYLVEKTENHQEKGKERGRMMEGGGGKEGKWAGRGRGRKEERSAAKGEERGAMGFL